MLRTRSLVCAVGLWACAWGCAKDAKEPAADSGRFQPSAAGAPGPARMCTREPDCQDLNTAFFRYPACCSATYACGYELSYEDDFVMVYPQIRDVLAELTVDDPNGKCVPASFLFPIKPGTYDHRVELPGEPEDDILVAAQCESRALTVFTLPGCCMPDDRCGISTDEIADTFQVLLEGESAPFTQPECLSAAALNTQLRASKLAAFARIPETSGSACDHGSLAQAIPRYRQAGR